MAAAGLALWGACAFDPAATAPTNADADASSSLPPEAGPAPGNSDVGPGGPGPVDAGFEPDASTPFDAGTPMPEIDGGNEMDAGNVVSECGNGIREGAETCDDRNQTNGDGCTAQCTIQPGWVCARDERSRCFLEGDVTYVDASRADCPYVAGNGTQAQPYCSIREALDSVGVSVVFVAPGTYAESLRVEANANVELIADGSVRIDGQTDVALEARGGAQVVATGFQLSGGLHGAIRVRETGTKAELRECEVGPSTGIGVRLSDHAKLVMKRSLVAHNTEGGLFLDSAEGYKIHNVVITDNGSSTAAFGGVTILQRKGNSKFTNNTVVDNESSDVPAGVVCTPAGTPIINSIVWDNEHALGPSTVGTQCVVTHSVLGPAGNVSDTNINANPRFVVSDPWFHILADSPCRDAANPGPAPVLDVDGQSRPNVGVDIGADEYQ